PSVMGRLKGIQHLLGPVDMVARPGLLVLVDLGAPTGADNVRDRVGAEQDEAPLVDLEVVAVERAHGRPRGAVALGVVLAAVTGGGDGGSGRRRGRPGRA